MTTPDGTSEAGEPGTPDATPEPGPGPISQRPARMGATTFSIEGRTVPALFVVGWLASLLGLGLVVVAVLAGGSPAAIGLLLVGLGLLAIGLIAAAGSQGIERRARGVLDYAGPSPLLVFAATIPVSLLVLIVVGIPFGIAGVALDGPAGALLSVVIQAIVYVAMIRLLVVDTGALDWRAMGLRPLDRAALTEIAGGAIWAVPVIGLTVPVSLVLLAIFPVTPESPLPATGEAIGFGLSLLAGAVVAPLGEEILFRAFATTAWVRGVGVRQGILRAAMVFAVAHVLTTSGMTAGDALGLAVVGFGTRVPIALALGWIFVRRRTIWASFGLHAAFNAWLLVIAELAARAT